MTSPEYELKCSDQCSLKNRTEISDALARGESYNSIAATFKVALSTLSRHRKHMRIAQPDVLVEPDARIPHLSVLEAIIAAGWANRGKWRPTIGDTMKAMDMYLKMTQGSAFQDLLDALASDVAEDDEPSIVENPQAVAEVAGGND